MHAFLNTLRLHQHAVKACRGMPGAPEDRTPNPQALTSIVFAAISLEAFINELTVYVSMVATENDASEWALALSQVLHEAEDSRISVQSKYMLARLALTGKPFAKGDSVYQNFDTLVRLRDKIVHPKPLTSTREYQDGRWVEPEDRGIISRLRPGVLADVESIFGEVHDTAKQTWAAKIQINFFDQISTRALARWACNAAAAMITATLKCIPDADTATRLQRVCTLERIE